MALLRDMTGLQGLAESPGRWRHIFVQAIWDIINQSDQSRLSHDDFRQLLAGPVWRRLPESLQSTYAQLVVKEIIDDWLSMPADRDPEIAQFVAQLLMLVPEQSPFNPVNHLLQLSMSRSAPARATIGRLEALHSAIPSPERRLKLLGQIAEGIPLGADLGNALLESELFRLIEKHGFQLTSSRSTSSERGSDAGTSP